MLLLWAVGSARLSLEILISQRLGHLAYQKIRVRKNNASLL